MNYQSKFYHGIMFHHFHDKKNYKPSQGSIDSKSFKRIISKIGKKNILNAEDFKNKLINKTIRSNHVCITFDDGLLCQYKIAYPILKKLKIKAFWFIYSSILTSKPSKLEIFREFRNSFYKKIDDFYEEFFYQMNFYINEKKYLIFLKKRKKNFNDMKKKFPFYSKNDIKFRITRDLFLDDLQYNKIMEKMIKKKNISEKDLRRKLYLNIKHIKEMLKDGQTFGLHSHNHPTNFNFLSKTKQKSEYKKNIYYFKKYISKNHPFSMSHPCGVYNKNLLKFLKMNKIQIGFRSNMQKKNKIINTSNLEIARQDHTNIIKIL